MKKKTTEDFIIQSNLKHENKYDYSSTIYINANSQVVINCKKHGKFYQIANAHLRGNGCKKCYEDERGSKLIRSQEDFIKDCIKIHMDTYDYSKSQYQKNNIKVKIICKEHGIFEQTPASHLQGSGCPKCGIIRKNNSNRTSLETFLKKANEVHKNRYDYSKTILGNQLRNKVKIICKQHGEFTQSASSHMCGSGCTICGYKKVSKSISHSQDEFIEKAKHIHLNKYTYDNSIYINNKKSVTITCPEHGDFEQRGDTHLRGLGCKKCSNNGISIKETELYNFIKEYIPNTIQSYKIGNKEIDIYIPELNLGIEFNGLYWHSDNFKDNNSHLNKLNLSNENNINLIQIFEDELDFKEEIVKSRILNILGKTPNKIYARKTLIKEVPTSEAMKFLEENHIQGKVGGSLKLGLYLGNELVSIMTFGNLRKNLGQTSKEGSYELLRFCNKLNTTVIGGASKLFKYFIKTYSPEKVISYADRRWSQGNLYFNLGFDFIHNSQPNYFYVKNGLREARFKYRKDILVSQGYDKNKTEREIMKELGYNRIYDCGAMKFEWKNN